MDTRPQFPIPGMTAIPAFYNDPSWDILMGGAWFACVIATSEQDGAVEAFQKASGVNLSFLSGRTPIGRMIDKSTGRNADVMAKWADWVTENVWGIEGTEDDEEPEEFQQP